METLDALKIALTALVAYLLGSVNFAVILSKVKGKDIRTVGSKNAGSTNMFRNFGAKLALVTFFGDFAKGVLTVVIAGIINKGDSNYDIIRGVSAIFVLLGHMKPLYFGFKGGKGVATALGAMSVLAPVPFTIVFISGVSIIAITGYVSMAALSMGTLYPFIIYFWQLKNNAVSYPFILISVIIASMVLFSHRGNAVRIKNKTESSIYKKRK